MDLHLDKYCMHPLLLLIGSLLHDCQLARVKAFYIVAHLFSCTESGLDGMCTLLFALHAICSYICRLMCGRLTHIQIWNTQIHEIVFLRTNRILLIQLFGLVHVSSMLISYEAWWIWFVQIFHLLATWPRFLGIVSVSWFLTAAMSSASSGLIQECL